MLKALSSEVPQDAKARKLEPVTAFSTFFAEWEMRETTLLIHLFPRAGEEDKWEEGHYLPKCRACRRDIPVEMAINRKPCPACGHIGLIYVPGRQEEKSKAYFPRDVLNRAKEATDACWQGYVAIEPLQELGAVVVQFQDVNLPDSTLVEMLDKFFDAFDRTLEAPAPGR